VVTPLGRINDVFSPLLLLLSEYPLLVGRVLAKHLIKL
jgi:hypothetical protein